MGNVLGLDISTAKIGIAILNQNQEILLSKVLIFKKGLSLVEKAKLFREEIIDVKREFAVDKVYIEEALKMFSVNQSMAATICLLQSFNGMVQYIVYDVFSFVPNLLNVNSARKLCGIKIDRKIKYKNVREKKQSIVKFICDKYKDFKLEMNRNGIWKESESDRCDAIVIALAGILFS